MSGHHDDHVDFLPGWAYLELLPQMGEVFEDERLWTGLRDFADQVLGEHRHRFYRGDGFAIVAVAPPDAEDVAERLRDSFMSELQATCDPSDAQAWTDEHANPN